MEKEVYYDNTENYHRRDEAYRCGYCVSKQIIVHPYIEDNLAAQNLYKNYLCKKCGKTQYFMQTIFI